MKAAEIGRTKPSHAPKPAEKQRKKNDGRPPDTIKELLLGAPTKKSVSKLPNTALITDSTNKSTLKPQPKTSGKVKFGPPSYPWRTNSCWLDASLEVLYAAITVDFIDFFNISQPLSDPDVGLGALYTLIHDRHQLNSYLVDPAQTDTSAVLGEQRDKFRLFLYANKIIQHTDQFESAVVMSKLNIVYWYSHFCLVLSKGFRNPRGTGVRVWRVGVRV